MVAFAQTLQEVLRDVLEQLGVFVFEFDASSGTASTVGSTELAVFSQDSQLSGLYTMAVSGSISGESRVVKSTILTASPPQYTVHKDFSSSVSSETFWLWRQFSKDEVVRAINRAVRRVATRVLVPTISDGGITLATDTYEYSAPSGMLGVYEIWREDATDTYEVFVPYRYWDTEPATGEIHFNRRAFDPTNSKKLRLKGYTKPSEVSGLSDSLDIDSEYVINRVVSWMLPRVDWRDDAPDDFKDKYIAANDMANNFERQVRTRPEPHTRWLELR